MSNWPFRFVHAADLHLEMPPFGVSEVPEHLAELFLESPYRAAQRVFETAMAEQVDFLVLSGDVLDCHHTGPRGPLFLVEQFRRLAERNIAVYWAGGRVDPPEAWPPSIRLPENVHVFGQGDPEEFLHRRDGAPIVRLAGAGRARRGKIRPSQFDSEGPGLFTVAVAHGTAELEAFRASRVDYWALGGVHGRSTLSEAMPLVHYPGSPQGRQPEESGPHGCTLLSVDRQRNIQATPIPTDVVRWQNERIAVDTQTSRSELETLLRERMRGLIDATPGIDLLVSWTIGGAGPIVAQLRRGILAGELLGQLRKDYGFGPPAAWSVSISVEPSAVLPPAWYEQETIRGDFLRHIARYQGSPSESLGLAAFLPAHQAAGAMAATAAIADPPTRLGVLREAAMLGVDLLSGEEPKS
jgi:DNA repair exonuclease SbcCD nuclease subunit